VAGLTRPGAGVHARLVLGGLAIVSLLEAVRGAVGVDRLLVRGRRDDLDQRVLGGQHQERGAEQGVGAGGEHLEVSIGAVQREVGRGRPRSSADPLALADLGGLGPVDGVEALSKLLGEVA
jgi:hypothetical protein